MKRLLFFLLFLPLLGCPSRQVSEAPEASQAQDSLVFKKAKNIVLLIGDGMGLTQISAGMYSNGNKLNLEEFLYIGLHKPHAINDLVTDSAAGATAFASGIKTYNGAIGMSNERQPVKTILEDAEAKGMSTGLVVTSSITHATPAAFYAHQPDRRLMEAIAADLAKSDVDFFVGGGLKYFNRREDWRNLVEEMKAKNYFVSDFLTTEFKDIAIPFHQKFAYFTADTEPLSFSQGRDYLVQACQNAVTFLSSQPGEKGFFLMIEGSQIDWGGHANDSDYIISEMIEFDKAIGVVLDFAKEDGETLVIVTADHETGGYALNPGSKMDSISPAFTTKDHTAVLIPVFAWGPGAELFGGIYENTAIYGKMRRAVGFEW